MELTGVSANDLEMVSAKVMDKALYQAAEDCVIYVCCREENTSESKGVLSHSQLNDLCVDFDAIFVEMQGLPPKRSHGLCRTNTTMLKWTLTRGKFFKNTYDTCVRHACRTRFGHDTAL